MSTALKYSGIILVVAFLCYLALVVVYVPNSKPSPKMETLHEVNDLNLFVWMLEAQEHKQMSKIIDQKQNPHGLNKNLVSLAAQFRVSWKLSEFWSRGYIHSSEFVDAWGRPLQVEWRENLTDTRYDLLKSNVSSSVIIWSFGSNGLNDYGGADDITGSINYEAIEGNKDGQ